MKNKFSKFILFRGKRAWAQVVILIGTALISLLPGLMEWLNPSSSGASSGNILSNIPIWGWIAIGFFLILLIMPRRKR